MSLENLENYQWKVTDYGLETRDNNDEFSTEYSIPALELFDLIENDEICFFRALLPLLGREWVIGDKLTDIYPIALSYHANKLNIQIHENKIKVAIEHFKSNDTWLKAKKLRARYI